ncbi:hypothetical protein BDW68DRAFT_74900 [Aspergillus falconensis]
MIIFRRPRKLYMGSVFPLRFPCPLRYPGFLPSKSRAALSVRKSQGEHRWLRAWTTHCICSASLMSIHVYEKGI